MWKSRLFWKLFIAYFVLNVLLTGTSIVIVAHWYRQQIDEQADRRLRDAAVLVHSQFVTEMTVASEPLQAKVCQLGQSTNTRITLVGTDGRVLADSTMPTLAKVMEMDNHSTRPEIKEAQETGEGRAERVSLTMSESMRYYALRAQSDNDQLGVVRVSLSTAAIQHEVAEVQRLVAMIAFFATLSVVVVTYLVVTRIVQPVNRLSEAANALARGDYQHQIVVTPYHDELGELGVTFEHMRRELASQVTQLRTTSERLSTVLGGMNEAVIAVDDQHQVLFANIAAGRMLDFSTSESEGRRLLECVRLHELSTMVSDTLSEGVAKHRELDFGSRDQIISVNSTPLPGRPSPGAVLVLRDITELRRLESVRQEFVANVSHELKTPLSSIKAYAETLSQGALEDPINRTRFVRQIENQAERLDQLIVDLLSLAKIESGQQAFDIEPVALEKAVQASMRNHRDGAGAKRIQLVSQPSEIPVHVRADAEGVRQILDNLIDNAIKYTADEGTVTVSWATEDNMARIQVQDTGIGIAPEDQARLFERFFRVDKARSRELGGTGLGLSIVKHLAQFFGGTVGVASQPGQGTTFSVRLPLA